MTDTQLTDVTVAPEDRGTKGDANATRETGHAAHFATYTAQQGEQSYIERGFVPQDASGTIPAGTAFVRHDGGSQTYDDTSETFSAWNSPLVFLVELHSDEDGLAFDADAENDVYLAIDLGASEGNGAYIRHGSNVVEPDDPSVKLGVVDTAMGEVTPSEASNGPVGEYRRIGSSTNSVSELYSESLARQTTTQTNDYDASAGDAILADASGGTFAVTLPPPEPDNCVAIIKIDSTGSVVTIEPNDDESVNFGADETLAARGESIEFVSDGSDWYVL